MKTLKRRVMNSKEEKKKQYEHEIIINCKYLNPYK